MSSGRRMMGGLLAASLVSAGATAAAPGERHDPAPAGSLRYELAEAGSYELPTIDTVSPHALVGSDGEAARLPAGGRDCEIVSFVYLHCTDAMGCPLALATLQRLDRAVAARADLAARVGLVTVTFDPERDGPAEMARLRRFMAPRGDWRFLTAASPAELAPVLKDYGQDAVPLVGADGAPLGLLRHVTKVFLVDDAGRVRNVYSSGFLDHRVVLRDIETVLGQGPPSAD